MSEKKKNGTENNNWSEHKQWSSKPELEQQLMAGIHGTPELKKEERDRHLGEFKERIIKALTIQQVHEEGTYPEILDAIRHPQARRLIISRQVDLDYARDYIQLARLEGLAFTTVDNPDFKGDVGLIVVSDDAVDEGDIYVPNRKERLLAQGLSESLIDARGEYICGQCIKELKTKAPEELAHYKKLSFIDKLLGKKCTPCE